MTNKTRTNKAHGMGWNKPDELRDKVEAWYEESFEIDLKAARNNWPDKRCGADDAIDALLKLVAAHTTKAVEEAEIRGKAQADGFELWGKQFYEATIKDNKLLLKGWYEMPYVEDEGYDQPTWPQVFEGVPVDWQHEYEVLGDEAVYTVAIPLPNQLNSAPSPAQEK
jgi:hypothetical protein